VKASSYNSEKASVQAREFTSGQDLEKNMDKFESDLREQQDNIKLIYRSGLKDLLRSNHNTELLFADCDDGASYEANFFFYFISGLYE
jgi:hypothetical protein